ncbi:MAG TPA: hypothetical protein VKQ72_06520 [Aggregatilineales bacterium]|nr:hypothetical protein [Aggregatilineales bacterium]
MNRVTELIPYNPAYASQTVQAYLEVFTAPPWNEALSLNDALSQLETDAQREGFGGILARTGQEIGGFSWWFDISGPELNDRWRLRFAPKEKVPHLEGRGVFLMEFGILPTLRHHGLGKKILDATLEQIEPNHDWIALNTSNIAHAGLALLKSRAFEDLGLKGIQVPTRICLVKWMHP